MRKSRRRSSSGRENPPCRLLLANNEGGLQEVRTVLQAMPAARRLAQSASRGVEVDLQPLAVSYLGNRHPGTIPAGDQADEVLGGGRENIEACLDWEMRVENLFASHKERKERKIQKKREEVEREAKEREKEKEKHEKILEEQKAWEKSVDGISCVLLESK